MAFGDHHRYSRADMGKLMQRANRQNAALITTAKDSVRLPASLRECAAVLDMELVFDNGRSRAQYSRFYFKAR